jgi:starch phosphorylase
MSIVKPSRNRTISLSENNKQLREQYDCDAQALIAKENVHYQRHLVFDHVVSQNAACGRERFEAFARVIRDVLAQRWIRTDETYARENPKRVYYLSMEFLIGRALANNVTKLLLDTIAQEGVARNGLDWQELLAEEPDAGLGNGGLGRLAACFLDSLATLQIPAMGYGLRYEYGIFRQTIENGWQCEQPDNWLRRPDPWEIARPLEAVEVKLNCSFALREGERKPVLGMPSSRIGLPYDRPVGGYGPPPHPIISTSASSAAAISWARSPKRWRQNR